jgi:hypothetical protein
VARLAVRANLFRFQTLLIGVLVIAHNSLISILVRTGRVPAIEDGFSQSQIETPWRLLPIATLPQEFMSQCPESGQTRTDVNDPKGNIRVRATMKSPRQEARSLHSPDVTRVSNARRQIYS